MTRNFRLVRPLMQTGCALFAVFTSLTRVSDYKHHAGDVISGAVLGLAISSLTVTVVYAQGGINICIMNVGMFQFLLKKKEVHQTRATSVTSLVRTDSVSRMMYTDNTSP